MTSRKMTNELWRKIKYFTSSENWGNASQMEYALLLMLDELRVLAQVPIVVHCGFATSGHSSNSYHYKGMAADIHIVSCNLLDQYLLAERVGFSGIGVYPYWNSPGLHVDIRDVIFDVPRSRWCQEQSGIYRTLTSEVFHEG